MCTQNCDSIWGHVAKLSIPIGLLCIFLYFNKVSLLKINDINAVLTFGIVPIFWLYRLCYKAGGVAIKGLQCGCCAKSLGV